MHKQISPASGYGIHLQAWIPHLAVTLLMNKNGGIFGEYLNYEEASGEIETDMDS